MEIKARGSEDFVITHNGHLYIVDMDFNYPEKSEDPRWFVHLKREDGDGFYWEEVGTFAPSEFNEAIYYISQGAFAPLEA